MFCQQDFDVIVLKEKHRVSNQDINKANEEWVKHLNLIRLCRNEYMEIFKNSMKKGRGEALNAQIKKFSELKNECAEKVAAVSYLGGNAIPFPSHLQKIPALVIIICVFSFCRAIIVNHLILGILNSLFSTGGCSVQVMLMLVQ